MGGGSAVSRRGGDRRSPGQLGSTGECLPADGHGVRTATGHRILRSTPARWHGRVDETERVLLLWRHRFTTNAWGWEIPAGWSEIGENPADAVRREVIEETGYRLGQVEPLVAYSPLTGISPHRYRLFLARDAVHVGGREVAESEHIKWVSVARVPELAARGLVSDGPSLTGLIYYLAVTRCG